MVDTRCARSRGWVSLGRSLYGIRTSVPLFGCKERRGFILTPGVGLKYSAREWKRALCVCVCEAFLRIFRVTFAMARIVGYVDGFSLTLLRR